MTEKELFISWLNDAYSTELAMMPVLENHANDAGDFPEIYDRKMLHLEETRRQAERLETMIKSIGGKVSRVKTAIGTISGMGQSISTEFFSDEIIKNFLADYSAEHLEIASYVSLIATAKQIGEDQCVPVLEEILAEERAMARWLEEHIPMATAESLRIAANESLTKRRNKNLGRRKKGGASWFFQPAVLVPLLTAGAGITLLWRLAPNKNGSNGAHRLTEGINVGKDNLNNDGNDSVEETNVVVTETVIIAEEPDLMIALASDKEGL